MNNSPLHMPVRLDLAEAIANLRRQGTPPRVFQFEHGIEPPVKQALCERFELCQGLDPADRHYELRRDIRVHEWIGLEFMRVMVYPPGLVWHGNPAGQIPPAVGPIQSWADFEAYPWPDVNDIDFSALDWLETELPDEMATWAMVYLFQKVSDLIGFEPMCAMVYEQPDLLQAVAERVTEFSLAYAQRMCAYRRCQAIGIGDDLGHKTGTLLAPAHIREFFIPGHTAIADAVHAAGRLCIFHSCGLVTGIMDDLINTVRCDAHHSTQDVIMPITEMKRRYGARIALLGGVDVDFVTRARVEQVRPYVRNILERCVPGGGFALGVGNWVAASIPLENYLALIEEARCFGPA